MDAIFHRTSIRQFEDRKVEQEKIDKILRAAMQTPMAIVITYKDGGIFPDYNDIDCAIATENIWLEADALGLGTVMLGIAPLKERMAAVGEILGLSDDEHAFTILPIGYPVKVNPQQDRYDEKKVHIVE